MTWPKTTKPAPASAGNGRRKIDLLGRQITPENTSEADTAQPLIDKHGHAHSEAVLRHWSPAVLKAMGVRRIKPDEAAGGVV